MDGQWPSRGDHLQRLVACDARRSWRLHAVVSHSARAVIAALLGAALLLLFRQKRPASSDLGSLVVCDQRCDRLSPSDGVGAPAHHFGPFHCVHWSAPSGDSDFGVIRGGERPKPAFWLFSVVGAFSVAGFALTQTSRPSLAGDALMIAAIVLCGLGYAEGATLSRRLGGWQVISWRCC